MRLSWSASSRVLLRVAGEQLLPLAAQPPAVLAHRAGDVLADPVGHEEVLVLGPVVEALGGRDLVDAQGLAVGGVGALLVRGAVADHAVDDDQRRPVGLGLERLDRGAQGVEVVGVGDVLHRPAETGEAGRHVLAEREAGAALDGDPVVVVEPAQVRQLEVPGERGRLGADALHQAAVAGDGVDVVVEQVVAGPVERGGLPEPGDRHADAGGDAGAQRAGGALDPGGPPVLGVPGALGVELAEPRRSSSVTAGVPTVS